MAKFKKQRKAKRGSKMENRVALRWAGAQKILNFLSRSGAVFAGGPDNPAPLYILTEKYSL